MRILLPRSLVLAAPAALLLICAAGAAADIIVTLDNITLDKGKFTGADGQPFAKAYKDGIKDGDDAVTRDKFRPDQFDGYLDWSFDGAPGALFIINDSEAVVKDLHLKAPKGEKFAKNGSTGGAAFPNQPVVSDDGSMITFDGGNIPVRPDGDGAVGYVWMNITGNTAKEFAGMITPPKAKKPDEKKKDGGSSMRNDGTNPFNRSHASFAAATQTITVNAASVDAVGYLDGSTGSGGDAVMGANVTVSPMTATGLSPDLPGAWQLSNAFLRVVGGSSNFLLSATLTRCLLIPDSSMPGFDSVLQGTMVWEQSPASANSRLLDEFYGPNSPTAGVHFSMYTNLLDATGGLTGDGGSEGTYTITLPSSGAVAVVAIAAVGAIRRKRA